MNTKITALTLAAATAFAFTPKPASASNGDGAAIFGAIVGGIIVGAAIASADHAEPVYVSNAGTYCPPAPVVVADGYWTTTSVNVWVPAVWVVERDYYGRSTRRYVTGHYESRHDRVWVANNNRHDNRGHEVARGYGNDRHDNNRDRRDDHRDDRHDDRRDHR